MSGLLFTLKPNKSNIPKNLLFPAPDRIGRQMKRLVIERLQI